VRIPGYTSTGSKRPEVMFGCPDADPRAMLRAEGCRLWDEFGTEYIDMMMALGAVALGYGHPAVVAAAVQALRDGGVGSLAPKVEAEVAERLVAVIPGAEAVRFLKTGAEAAAAAVRVARVHTGHANVITCGYHGWLDWCQDEHGVPCSVKRLRRTIPFNDLAALGVAVARHSPVAAIVIEPVVDGLPNIEWLHALRETATASGAVLIFDEVKTAFRLAVGGAAEYYGIAPDLTVVGKALGNGLPIAAVCGPTELMSAAEHTWISSTLATEYVSLAAALEVLKVFEQTDVIGHLRHVGSMLVTGLERLAAGFPSMIAGVCAVPQMCYLKFRDDELSGTVALQAVRMGLLWRRTAYNFVSLAHTEEVVRDVLQGLEAALQDVEATC
jgi:glutamate-1-semialdehyde 2,1-aminomutase